MNNTFRVLVNGGQLTGDDSGRQDDGGLQGTAVVLLHGFSFDRSMWDGQLETLGQGRRLVTYDLRGHGGSAPLTRGCSHIDDLLGVLDALGITRAVLLGLSLGANIAQAFAVQYPERVTGLILASPGLPGMAWAGSRPPEEAAEVARNHGVEAAKRFWFEHPLFTPARADTDCRHALRTMISRFPAEQWQGVEVPAMPAIVALLAGLKIPTLVLSGELDGGYYRAAAQEIAVRVPGAEYVSVPDAGHTLNLEEPGAFNKLAAQFLARTVQVNRLS